MPPPTVPSISFRPVEVIITKAPLLCYAREGPVGSRAQDNSPPCWGVMGHRTCGDGSKMGLGFVLRALFLFVLIRIFDLAF